MTQKRPLGYFGKYAKDALLLFPKKSSKSSLHFSCPFIIAWSNKANVTLHCLPNDQTFISPRAFHLCCLHHHHYKNCILLPHFVCVTENINGHHSSLHCMVNFETLEGQYRLSKSRFLRVALRARASVSFALMLGYDEKFVLISPHFLQWHHLGRRPRDLQKVVKVIPKVFWHLHGVCICT